jgi:hypothetical protein
MRESLENVKVGDVVIIHKSHHRKVGKVTKVTATLIHTDNCRYRKKDGNIVGFGPWDLQWITIPEEGEVEQIRQIEFRCRVVEKLRSISIHSVSYTQAVKIKEVLGL